MYNFPFYFSVRTTEDVLNGASPCVVVSSSKDSTVMVHNKEKEMTETIQHFSKQVNCVRYTL